MDNYTVETLQKHQVFKCLTWHTSILGASGSGKSYLAKEIFNYMPYSGLFVNTMQHAVNGIEINLDNWADCMFPHTQGNIVKTKITRKVHQRFDDFSLQTEEIIEVVRTIQEATNGNLFYIFVDEVNFYKAIDNCLRETVLTGQNHNLFLVSISQRPQNVDKNIFTQSNMVYSTFEEFDITYLKKLGIKPLAVNFREFVYYPKVNREGEEYIFRMKL